MPALTPDRMKQTEAGLRKKGTPLLRDMAMQMAPMAIMVRLRRASTAAVRFRSTGRSTVRRLVPHWWRISSPFTQYLLKQNNISEVVVVFF